MLIKRQLGKHINRWIAECSVGHQVEENKGHAQDQEWFHSDTSTYSELSQNTDPAHLYSFDNGPSIETTDGTIKTSVANAPVQVPAVDQLQKKITPQTRPDAPLDQATHVLVRSLDVVGTARASVERYTREVILAFLEVERNCRAVADASCLDVDPHSLNSVQRLPSKEGRFGLAVQHVTIHTYMTRLTRSSSSGEV